MKLIALSGKRGSGKTSCANYLKNQYGAIIISLATPIKEELVAMGFDKELVYAKPTPPEIRGLMVALAKARRYVDIDHYVKVFMKKLAVLYTAGTDLVVCDDLRHTNEKNRFRDYGASIIRVECPDLWDHQEFTKGIDDDISEIDLDSYHGFDYVIRANKGKLCSMFEQLVATMEEIK